MPGVEDFQLTVWQLKTSLDWRFYRTESTEGTECAGGVSRAREGPCLA